MENQSLIADLVGWISKEPRPYHEVMDAWKTSCPRLSIWEDTVDLGFVKKETLSESGRMVFVTEKGIQFLKNTGRITNH